jgi:hypothetical protein
MKMTLNIVIGPDGQVKADVQGGRGPVCITEILGPLEGLLGEADRTDIKPEFAIDEEAQRIIQQQGVRS